MTTSYVGTWWIADPAQDRDIRKVGGTLTVDEDGRSRLRTWDPIPLLVESIEGRWRAMAQSATALVVHGQVEGGRQITLLRVSGNGHVLRAQAVIEDTLLMPGVLKDAGDGTQHVPVPGEDVAAFAGIRVEIEHLSEWSGIRPVRLAVPKLPQQHTVPLVLQDPPSPVTATLRGGTTFTLRPRTHLHRTTHAGRRTVSVTETVIAEITTAQPVSLNVLLGHVTSLRRLVGVALRREVGVLSAALLPADDPSVTLQLRKVFLPAADPDAPAVPQHRMLFALTQTPFEDLLPRWVEVAEELRGTVAALVAAHDHGSLLEPRLMAATTAAENLFAKLCRGTTVQRMPTEDFARLKQVVLASLDAHPKLQGHREFLSTCVTNQPALRQRLVILCSELGAHAAPLLAGDHTIPVAAEVGQTVAAPGDRPEFQAWAWAAARARNDVAHEGVTKLDTTASLTTLAVTTAVVELLLLRYLGLDDSLLAELVRDHHYGLARRIRDDLMPYYDAAQAGGNTAAAPARRRPARAVLDDLPEVEDGADPLVVALLDSAGTTWKAGWVPWGAVAAAARRRGALPTEADQHEALQTALDELLGPIAPQPENGRDPAAGLGYSTLTLFLAVNDYYCTAGLPIPTDRWRRHSNLGGLLDVLPLLPAVLDAEDVTVAGVVASGGLTVEQAEREHVETLILEHADQVRAWFAHDTPLDVAATTVDDPELAAG